ncbi:hypothetical protein GCM10027614_61990 [Micromonospora vulcania]
MGEAGALGVADTVGSGVVGAGPGVGVELADGAGADGTTGAAGGTATADGTEATRGTGSDVGTGTTGRGTSRGGTPPVIRVAAPPAVGVPRSGSSK